MPLPARGHPVPPDSPPVPRTVPDRPRALRRAVVPSWPSVAEHLSDHRRRVLGEIVGAPEHDAVRERRPEAPRPA